MPPPLLQPRSGPRPSGGFPIALAEPGSDGLTVHEMMELSALLLKGQIIPFTTSNLPGEHCPIFSSALPHSPLEAPGLQRSVFPKWQFWVYIPYPAACRNKWGLLNFPFNQVESNQCSK